MKNLIKKQIALALIASAIAAQAFGTHPAPRAVADTPAAVNPQEKTNYQKAVNLVGAMTRGAMRGAVTGFTSAQFINNTEEYNADAVSDVVAEFACIPQLADEVFVKIDESTTTNVVEALTAAVMHTLLTSNHHSDLTTEITRCIARITHNIDIRNASKMRRYTTLITRFLVESINQKALDTSRQNHMTTQDSILAWFRPVVGATAVLRTLLVEKIIDNRLAAKSITAAQINRTRVVLNGTLGFAMNIGANWLNDKVISTLCGKDFFDRHSLERRSGYLTARTGTPMYYDDVNQTWAPLYTPKEVIDGKTYRFNNQTGQYVEEISRSSGMVLNVETVYTTADEIRNYEIIFEAPSQSLTRNPVKRRHKTTGVIEYRDENNHWQILYENPQTIDGRNYQFNNHTRTFWTVGDNPANTYVHVAADFATYTAPQRQNPGWNSYLSRQHRTTKTWQFSRDDGQTWQDTWRATKSIDGLECAFNNRTYTYWYLNDANQWIDTQSHQKPRVNQTGELNGKQAGSRALGRSRIEYFRDADGAPWQRMWRGQQIHRGVRYDYNVCTASYWRQVDPVANRWQDTGSDQLP